MPVSPKLLGVAVIAGLAPAPALAQPALAALSNGMTGPVAVQAPSPARPVSLAARQAVARAPFERPGLRVLDLTVRGDRKLREVRIREKDAWTDDEGFRFTAAKLAYVRRF